MYGCESWMIKKAENQRIDVFELWWWRKLLRVFSAPLFKSISSLVLHLLYGPTLTTLTTGKTITLIRRTFFGKVMSLLFNMLSRFVIAFLPGSKSIAFLQGLIISWLRSRSTVIFEPKKIKAVTVSMGPYLFAMKWWDQMPWSLFFWIFGFKPAFFTLLFHCHQFLPLGWCHLHTWGYWYFSQQSWFQLCASSLSFHMIYST